MVKVMLIVNMIMLRRMTKATVKMKRKGSMLATWSPPLSGAIIWLRLK